jgi:hypothetical protein
MYLKTRSIFKVGVILNNVFTYIDKVFLCLHNFFSLNPSKLLGNAGFLAVQTEQVMHNCKFFCKKQQNQVKMVRDYYFLFFNETSVLILKTKTSLHFILHVNFL